MAAAAVAARPRAITTSAATTPTLPMEAATALADEPRARIGGIVDPRGEGAVPREAIAGMRSALGEGAQLLLAPGAVADRDACSIEGASVREWSGVRSRLHEIDGAFAAAW